MMRNTAASNGCFEWLPRMAALNGLESHVGMGDLTELVECSSPPRFLVGPSCPCPVAVAGRLFDVKENAGAEGDRACSIRDGGTGVQGNYHRGTP